MYKLLKEKNITQDQIVHATVLTFFHDIPAGVLVPWQI